MNKVAFSSGALSLVGVVTSILVATAVFLSLGQTAPEVDGDPVLAFDAPVTVAPRHDAIIDAAWTEDDAPPSSVPAVDAPAARVDGEPSLGWRIDMLRQAVFATPYRWAPYQELLFIARVPEEKDAVLALLLDVLEAFPDSSSAIEAIGRFYVESGDYALAVPYLESVKGDVERAMEVRMALSIAQLDSSSPEAAIAEAEMVRTMVRARAMGQDDATFKSIVLDGHLWNSCLVQAIGYLHLDDAPAGKAVLRHCFDGLGVLADETAAGQDVMNQLADMLEDWRGMSYGEVTALLD